MKPTSNKTPSLSADVRSPARRLIKASDLHQPNYGKIEQSCVVWRVGVRQRALTFHPHVARIVNVSDTTDSMPIGAMHAVSPDDMHVRRATQLARNTSPLATDIVRYRATHYTYAG